VAAAGWARRSGSPRRVVAGVLLGVGGLLVAVALQASVWDAIYGTPLLVPQGQGWMVWEQPFLYEVLFSDPKGILFNSPLMALALFGVILVGPRDRWWSVGALLAIASAVYVSAASSQWAAGESFGMRRLASMLPIFAVGLAELASLVRRRSWTAFGCGAAGLCVLWHWAVLLQYFHSRIINP